jgi:hypothetical protein
VLRLGAGGRVAEAARRHHAWIAEEVLAVDFRVADLDGGGSGGGASETTATVDGEPVAISLERA